MAPPRIDEVPSSVAVTAIARQLAATYSDFVAESLPQPLAGLAERLSQEDRSDTALMLRVGGEIPSGSSIRQSGWPERTLGRSKEAKAP
jgi:hypothetical protein